MSKKISQKNFLQDRLFQSNRLLFRAVSIFPDSFHYPMEVWENFTYEEKLGIKALRKEIKDFLSIPVQGTTFGIGEGRLS